MAFIRNKTHTALASTSGSITGTMPSYETGDLLFAFAIVDGNRLVTVDGAWTVLEQGNSIGSVGYSVAYIENATGSETAPVFSLSSNDTASVVVLAIGGVPTSSTIEASTTPVQLTATRSESPFTGVTTLTNNALVLHLFGNSGIGGCATDQGLLRVSDEIGYVGESAYLLEETPPNAGASASGNMLQFGAMTNFYMSLSIADGSSGSEIKPQQVGGGMELINALQGAESQTWLIGGDNTLTTPSDVTTPADYGTILGKTFRTVEAAADSQDSNTNPFLAAARFRGDRGAFYSGLRFGIDTQGTGGSIDMTGKALIATAHMVALQNSVKVQTKDAIGLGIILESGADDYNNYIAHTVSGSDSSSPKVTPLDGPCVINYDYGSEIASAGTFDETDLLKVSFIGASLNTNNLNMYICNIGLLSALEIVGGSSSIPVNQSYLYDVGYANLAYLIQNTGDLILSYAPWAFGNGVIDTYVDFESKTFSFPEQGADTGALVNDTFLGISFESTAGSDINCEGMTLASPTPFYLDVVNALGTINFTNATITNSQTCNIRGDFTGARFTPKAGTVIDDFDATIDDITVNGSLQLNSVRDLTNVTATKVILAQGGSYSFTGCSITGVENTSGSVVTITSDSPISIQTETSGTLNVLDSLLSFSGVNSWIVYANSTDQNADTNALDSGTVSDTYNYTYVASTTYYMRLTSGTDTIFKTVTPTASGETAVELTTAGLLTTLSGTVSSIDTQLGFVPPIVFCDPSLGANGDGSGGSPYNSLADAVTRAGISGAVEIDLEASGTLSAAASGVNIRGVKESLALGLNGQEITGSKFTKLLLYGSCVTTGSQFEQCYIGFPGLGGVSGFDGLVQGFILKNTLSLAGNSTIVNGGTEHGEDHTIEVNAGNSLSMTQITGNITVANVEAGSMADINFTNGHLTIDSSCTAGSIRVRGNATITDNSAGTAVTDETINNLSSADVTAAIPSEIDANIIKVNNVTIDGVGTKDNPFGP